MTIHLLPFQNAITISTESNHNTDVLQSEVKTLRQSAATMSAGQKEGASQIISDWLDESSDNEFASVNKITQKRNNKIMTNYENHQV